MWLRAYRSSVLQGKILIRELLSVDGLAAGTILPSKVATLAHEACGGRGKGMEMSGTARSTPVSRNKAGGEEESTSV